MEIQITSNLVEDTTEQKIKYNNVPIAKTAQAGWTDIVPVWTKDDGTGGWQFTAPQTGSGRLELSASSNSTVRTLTLKYHIPHEIVFNQPDSFYHLHWEVNSLATGNIILTAYMSAGKRDGQMSIEYPVVFTLTPSTTAINRHNVTELAIPTALIPYLETDAVWNVRIVRDRLTNVLTDTFNGTVFFLTADIHTRGDNTGTTSKDPGAGWVKIQ